MTLSPAFLDELRTRTQLSTLVGRSVKLTRAGREWKACCPFHDEKTPSFHVNDSKGFYHCFGCSAHGDAIRWLTDKQGLPFMDAVKELAAQAGMDVPAPDPRSARREEQRTTLRDVVEAAAAWFRDQLESSAGADARAYLDARGIGPIARERFGLGFAPQRGGLRPALTRFGDDLLDEAGLIIRPEEQGRDPFDRFRSRLIIPIRDARGRPIAFGGRILGPGEPKYLNSPETPLFDKGRTLFNLDRAAEASRKTSRLIVVEGYFDVIGLASVELNDSVAPLGTALTEEQIELLWRLVDTPLIMLDGDAAGQKAAIRAATRALPILKPGKSLKFAGLPTGYDPDDLARQSGSSGVEAVLKTPTSLSSVLYSNERNQTDVTSPESRAGLRARLDELASLCRHDLVSKEYKREFNGLFWDEFGWKKGERKVIASSVLKTGPRGNRNLMRLFVRSVLYGVSRYPVVGSHQVEPLGHIKIDHPDLLRWRETLVEALYTRPQIEADAVATILESTKLSRTQANDIRFDLRFPYTRKNAEFDLAVAQLSFMISFMSEESELNDRMAYLDKRALGGGSMSEYDILEAERQLMRERKAALYEKAYLLNAAS